ncbi:MAG: sugar ABC transporter substrate-binding protein [Clostridia bacterium]|nr:sugar ABC transporter substrate-binding protein [Clostridia bacterium]
MKLSKCLVTCLLVLTIVAISVSAMAADALEIKIWDNNQRAGLQEIADLWTEKSGIPVNIQVVTWDEYWTLLEAGATGGQMPDVFWMHSNNAYTYMQYDILLDLTDYIARDGVDMSKYYDGITKLYSLNDHQYALAKDHDTIALIYNKAIFDKYGVAYPTNDWTWDDYYAAGKAITEAGKADGIYGAACNTSNDQDGYLNIIYSYGGYIINEDHTASGWDNENTRKAMEFVGKLCSDVWCPQVMVAENGTDTLFNSGKVAMITQGSWMINTFYTDDDSANYAWAMLPYADVNGNGQCDEGERCTIYNGLGWSASTFTKQPDACWDLIKWFGSEEMQVKQAELGVTMAGMPSVSDAFRNAFPGMNIDAFLDMETYGTLVFRPYSKSSSRWEEQYHQELVPAWNDPSLMDGVLTNLAAEMNEILAAENR